MMFGCVTEYIGIVLYLSLQSLLALFVRVKEKGFLGNCE